MKSQKRIYSGEAESAAYVNPASVNGKHKIPWIRVIRWIYLSGFTLFFLRLVSLFFWLFLCIKRNPSIRKGRHIIVQLREEMPPFSFFRYVFVNEKVYSKADFDKILAHEITHIRQVHSLDLLFAHSMRIFHWFNPLAWHLHKAIKTNHEYLADEQVINQGYELFDYQSLLLTQLISIRSVELVNNFNLLSIQKRIAMMTKIKSGIKAKLKILLILPFTIFLFLFFADMTFYGSGKSISNFISLRSKSEIEKFTGVWQNLDENSYGRLLAFDEQSLSILEDDIHIRQYKAFVSGTTITLELWPGENLAVTYKEKGDILQVWWSDAAPSRYKKLTAKNSIEFAIGSIARDIHLPALTEYMEVDWPEYFNLVYTGEKLVVGKKEGSLGELDQMLKDQMAILNKLSMRRMTVKLFIDRDVSMHDLDQITMSLRKCNLLKIVYMGTPAGGEGSVLLAHTYGRTFKLPPLEGLEILSDDEAGARGIRLFKINACNGDHSPEDTRPVLKKHLIESQKYITPLEYNGKTKYSEVIAYMDMVFAVLSEVRNEYAKKEFGKKYDDLPASDQELVRTRYPATIMLKNTGTNSHVL